MSTRTTSVGMRCLALSTAAVRRLFPLLLIAVVAGCSDDLLLSSDDASLRMRGTLNGSTVDTPASAVLVRTPGAPDSLFLGGTLQSAYISIGIEYSGPGIYALTPDNTSVVLTVGGDVRVGEYRGIPPQAGELAVTDDEGPGGLLEATLWFDAEHVADAQQFGPTIAFRNGAVLARLRLHTRP